MDRFSDSKFYAVRMDVVHAFATRAEASRFCEVEADHNRLWAIGRRIDNRIVRA